MKKFALLLSLVGYASLAQPATGALAQDFRPTQEQPADGNRHGDYNTDGRTFAVVPVRFNSSVVDFSPFPYRNGLVFVSSRNEKGKVNGKEEEFLNLFYTEEHEDGGFSTPILFDKQNKMPYHQGPAVFFDHEKRKIFTRNAFAKSTPQAGDSVNSLELAESVLTGKKWTTPVSMPFNGPNFSVAHPAISTDGTTLYFSSNMPGTLGEADLFVSTFDGAAWSAPENLGPAINSAGREMFPYLLNDSILYFSSTRTGGLGGLDIYSCNLRDPQLTVKHLAAPINSPDDDFGIIFDRGNISGFFSSNRSGNDDIFYFQETCHFLAIELYDSLTLEYVSDAKLTLTDGERVVGETISDLSGRAEFRLSEGRSYQLLVTHSRYGTKALQFTDTNRQRIVKVPLAPVSMEAVRELHALQTSQRSRMTNSVTFSSAPLDVDVVETFPDPNKDGVQADSLADGKLKVIAVENVNALPAIIIVRNDSIFDFSPVSSSVLVNRQLKITIDMPLGAKRHDYEEIISAAIRADGYDVGKFLLIRSFFFDSEKTLVRNDASAQLDKIIDVMQTYPQIDVKLVFHSDSRGTDKFNLELSRRRAEEVTRYLRDGGISAQRIVSQFVGESKLLNDCGDLSDCDELLHQMNRTTEFELVLKKDQL